MNKTLAFILALGFIPAIFAQDNEPSSIDDIVVEEDPILKVLESRRANERKLGPKQIIENESHHKVEKEKKDLYQDEVQVFWAQLKEEALITEVDGPKRKFITPKRIYVQVRKEKNNYQTYFLVNKEGKVRYETSKENIISLQDVADLDPAPKHYAVYPTPREYDGGDTKLTLKPYYALHMESLTDQGQTAKATRNELKGFYGWKQPYEFGLSLSLESGKTEASESNNEESTWQAYYFGPVARWLAYDNDFIILSLDTSLQKSLSYVSSHPSYEDQYSAEVLELGGDFILPTRLGQFTAGMHWRFMRKSLDSSSDETRLPPTDKSGFTAFAFSIGYGKEFQW